MKNGIDWEGEETVFCGETSFTERKNLLPKGLLWIGSSGTTAAPKWIGLSREAILSSASAVNTHLRVTSDDVWLHALPDFHIAGLAIEARAWLAGTPIVRIGGVGRGKWRVTEWLEAAERATLSALVPTQVYDVVKTGVRAPSSMRAILVGGGALNEDLYRQARELGWPLLPSYGMTETASQIATASLDSLRENSFPHLTLLPHVTLRTDDNHILWVKGKALFSVILFEETMIDPKVEGWYRTNDRILLEKNSLCFMGREDDIVKIRGECVDLGVLQRVWDKMQREEGIEGEMQIVARREAREGFRLVLLVTEGAEVEGVLARYQQTVRPYERIDHVEEVALMPKTAIGKFKRPNPRAV